MNSKDRDELEVLRKTYQDVIVPRLEQYERGRLEFIYRMVNYDC